MGLLKRIKNIFRAKVNIALDSIEDPIKTIEVEIADKKEWIIKTKLEASKVTAYAKELTAKAEVGEEDIKNLEIEIEKAVANSREDNARTLIAIKLEKKKNVEYYKETADSLNIKVQKEFITKINEAEREIISAEATITGLKAELTTAELSNSIAKERAGLTTTAIDVSKLKSRINSIKYNTEGIDEVNNLTTPDKSQSASSLAIEAELSKYKNKV